MPNKQKNRNRRNSESQKQTIMTSFGRFYNLYLNLYDVIGDVTELLKISKITFFFKQ